MKNNYIKPSVSVSFAVLEPILLTGSGRSGIGKDEWDMGGSCSKKNEFTDDFFDDTPWPKSKSQWD